MSHKNICLPSVSVKILTTYHLDNYDYKGQDRKFPYFACSSINSFKRSIAVVIVSMLAAYDKRR